MSPPLHGDLRDFLCLALLLDRNSIPGASFSNFRNYHPPFSKALSVVPVCPASWAGPDRNDDDDDDDLDSIQPSPQSRFTALA